MSEDKKEMWHGTLGGYTNHRCRCEDCTRAQREWMRGYRRLHPERNNRWGRPKETRLTDDVD